MNYPALLKEIQNMLWDIREGVCDPKVIDKGMGLVNWEYTNKDINWIMATIQGVLYANGIETPRDDSVTKKVLSEYALCEPCKKRIKGGK